MNYGSWCFWRVDSHLYPSCQKQQKEGKFWKVAFKSFRNWMPLFLLLLLLPQSYTHTLTREKKNLIFLTCCCCENDKKESFYKNKCEKFVHMKQRIRMGQVFIFNRKKFSSKWWCCFLLKKFSFYKIPKREYKLLFLENERIKGEIGWMIIVLFHWCNSHCTLI